MHVDWLATVVAGYGTSDNCQRVDRVRRFTVIATPLNPENGSGGIPRGCIRVGARRPVDHGCDGASSAAVASASVPASQ